MGTINFDRRITYCRCARFDRRRDELAQTVQCFRMHWEIVLVDRFAISDIVAFNVRLVQSPLFIRARMMRQQRSTTQFRIRNTFSPLCVPNSNREINYNGGRACTQELASKWIRFNKVFSIQVSRTGSAYTHTVSAITLDSKYMVQLIFI